MKYFDKIILVKNEVEKRCFVHDRRYLQFHGLLICVTSYSYFCFGECFIPYFICSEA